MTRLFLSGKTASIAIVTVLCASLAGCGDDAAAGSATQSVGTSSPAFPIDRSATPATTTAAGMQIKGSPVTNATVGQAYNFQPTVSSGDGASLKFSIANLPAWAKFDSTSGKLSGTPTASQVGTYKSIAISVLAGKTSAALPAFSIVVGDANPASAVTLSWQPPTENADGTALVDLKGYKVHYGPSSRSYSETIQLSNPGLSTYVVQNLESGKYYFAVTAYNSAGQESSLSPEVYTQVD